jgi:hypothetical protein
MKMGWRPGQGIGPRVSARKRKIQEAKLLGRRTRPDVAEMTVDEEEGKHLFAPRDSKLMVFEQKSGKEGLGYVKGRGMQGLGKGGSVAKESMNLSGAYSAQTSLKSISHCICPQLDSVLVSTKRTRMTWTFIMQNLIGRIMAQEPPMTSTNTTTTLFYSALVSSAQTELEGASSVLQKRDGRSKDRLR